HGRRRQRPPRFCESGTIRVHTSAPEDAAPFGRAPPTSQNQDSRRARVTFASNDARVWMIRTTPAEPAAWHGGGPPRKGAYALRKFPVGLVFPPLTCGSPGRSRKGPH